MAPRRAVGWLYLTDERIFWTLETGPGQQRAEGGTHLQHVREFGWVGETKSLGLRSFVPEDVEFKGSADRIAGARFDLPPTVPRVVASHFIDRLWDAIEAGHIKAFRIALSGSDDI